VPVAEPVKLAVVPVIGVAVLTVIVAADGGAGNAFTVTDAEPEIPASVAVTVALPAEVPAVNRALVPPIAPSPVAVQVKLGCAAIGTPF